VINRKMHVRVVQQYTTTYDRQTDFIFISPIYLPTNKAESHRAHCKNSFFTYLGKNLKINNPKTIMIVFGNMMCYSRFKGVCKSIYTTGTVTITQAVIGAPTGT